MSDLEFLKELRDNVVKGKSDITRHEMALEMIDDWIKELSRPTPLALDAVVCTCKTRNISGVGSVLIVGDCPIHRAGKA